MRRSWGTLLACSLLALVGCFSQHRVKVEAPKHPERFCLPPDDPRYSREVQFPDKVLNKWQRNSDEEQGGPPGPGGRPQRSTGLGPSPSMGGR